MSIQRTKLDPQIPIPSRLRVIDLQAKRWSGDLTREEEAALQVAENHYEISPFITDMTASPAWAIARYLWYRF